MASSPDLVVKIVADRSAGNYQAYVSDQRGRARIAYGYPRETWDEARADAEALATRFRQHGHIVRLAVRQPKAGRDVAIGLQERAETMPKQRSQGELGDPEAGAVSIFEQIRHETDEGGEYWSARELAKVLGYARWENFTTAIQKAQVACQQSDQDVAHHFRDVTKMVTLGSGAKRKIADWHLSRYACYLIVQNADPEKPVVAQGQTYFAVQTRRAEIADELAGLTEAQKRLVLRQQMSERNVHLAAAASDAGVVTQRDFAIFQDHGYMGLYAGERARDITARKGLAPGEKPLDWMGSEELAANWFRATQTAAKLVREGIVGKAAANATHHEVGREVRATIERLGGTMPEDLPTPAESIKQLERREQKRTEAEQQPSLFPELERPGDPDGQKEDDC